MKITEAFLGEHAVFYAQFTECETMLDRSDLDGLKHAASVIASGLASHAELEDELLFRPLAARAGEDPGIFAVMEEEHAIIGDLLRGIADARDAGRASELLHEMIAAARAHFAKEEQVAFPLAEKLIDFAELRRLGQTWSDARGVVIEVTA